ncbi:hypothetical protein RLOC_00010335, partial [Lonchura striata]
VSVQTRYILVLFSQYLCKTKDGSYCCAGSQGRRDAVPRLPPGLDPAWRRLDRSLPLPKAAEGLS